MFRVATMLCFALVASLALFTAPVSAARQFPETGFSVTNDKFLDYFDHRGGARVLGYPVSREFQLQGTTVQIFQRAALQAQPGGGVGLLNILDDGLLPYTRINGSSFPAPDQAVLQMSPNANDPDYATRAIEFLRFAAPDTWQGMKTNFFTAFMNTVSYKEAFPNSEMDQSIMPLINLEIWGLPTSKPTLDPNNNNFVYLRFQRGIMHFDRTNGLTQGILIGDYLKAVLTGQNIPGDLQQQANSSKLYRQYNNGVIYGVARPNELPATILFSAFEQDGVVVPTPLPYTPAPVPPTATPTPVGPTPTPTLAPLQRPASIEVTGSPWYIDQTNSAISKAGDWVKDYVYRVVPGVETRTDFATRTFYVTEETAFPSSWRSNGGAQIAWYAGWIAHEAVHIMQQAQGRPYTGTEAELEARLRQKAVVQANDETEDQRLTRHLIEIINSNSAMAEWEGPPSP